ncbi:hypothetical protein CLOP_g14236 [Closterium sp. NIES-67]|nr:hypothetical protein CLOP_g14236 [Closterium sp. NIES-67]
MERITHSRIKCECPAPSLSRCAPNSKGRPIRISVGAGNTREAAAPNPGDSAASSNVSAPPVYKQRWEQEENGLCSPPFFESTNQRRASALQRDLLYRGSAVGQPQPPP